MLKSFLGRQPDVGWGERCALPVLDIFVCVCNRGRSAFNVHDALASFCL